MSPNAPSVPEVMKYDDRSRTTYLRDGIVFALFFGIANAKTADALAGALDKFVSMLPEDTLRWAVVSATAEAWKPFTNVTIKKCKAQLAFPAMNARKLTSFELRDGEKGGDAPQFGLSIFANSNFEKAPNKKNLLQIYFPSSFVEPDLVESFVKDIESIAAKIPFASGYCSPSLVFAESMISPALDAARKIALRHHGFDVQYNEMSRVAIDNRVRGARWINFLSREIVEQLGGPTTLEKSLPKPISFKEIANGFVIRSSVIPEIGDTNRQLGTPLLSKVALALEPVTRFEELTLLNYSFADGDAKVLSRWERRFFD